MLYKFNRPTPFVFQVRLFFLPETLEVEGKLPMVLDGQEHDSVLPHQVENEVVLHQAFPKIVALLEEPAKALYQLFGLCRLDGTIQKGPPGLREPAESRDGFVQQFAQQSVERRPPVGLKKLLDRGEIRREVFGKNRLLNGHAAT